MTETIADRLQKAVTEKNVDMKTASKMAGLGETYVRDVIRRGLNPTANALVKLADALEVNAGWLLTGEKGTLDEGELNTVIEMGELFSALSPRDQELVVSMMNSMLTAAKK